jgi:hypothetical protein
LLVLLDGDVNGVDAVRAARLARFVQLPIAPVAGSSTSRTSRGVRQSSRPSTSAAERQRTVATPRIISRNSRVPSNSLAVPREVPDAISSRASSIEISVFEKEEDEVEHPPPSPPPPPPPPPPPVAPPVGQHRIDNLICAQCRTPVARAPFRIFVLSETVSLVRNAEAAGMFNSTGSEIDGGGGGGGGTSSKGSTKGQKEKKVQAMNESDLTWGGLFGEAGEETRAMKRARNAQLMRDDDDGGVHRCGVCNWEVDANGVCEGWSVFFLPSLYSHGVISLDWVFIMNAVDE